MIKIEIHVTTSFSPRSLGYQTVILLPARICCADKIKLISALVRSETTQCKSLIAALLRLELGWYS